MPRHRALFERFARAADQDAGGGSLLCSTERPEVGTVKDPRTGKWMDETRYLIEAFDWLSDADKKLIFEGNAKKLFKLEGVGAA